MPIDSLGEATLRPLNAALRGEFTAVNQYFIHILVLRAWGDADTARRLEPVNNADFPNAMRIVEHVLERGGLPQLCGADEPFARHLPVVGDSRAGIFAADLALERGLLETLEAARSGLERSGDLVARQLVAEAESRRRPHMAWLERALGSGAAPSEGASGPAFGAATRSLNALLAHLMVALEQALVHAFVGWHAGERELADALWTISYDAMLQGAAIVNLFGAERTAPSFAGAAALEDLERPRVAGDVGRALALEHAVASRCRRRAEAAAELAGEGDAGAVCREVAAYFARVAAWLGEERRPVADFPSRLRSFEKLRAMYVA